MFLNIEVSKHLITTLFTALGIYIFYAFGFAAEAIFLAIVFTFYFFKIEYNNLLITQSLFCLIVACILTISVMILKGANSLYFLDVYEIADKAAISFFFYILLFAIFYIWRKNKHRIKLLFTD